MPTHHSCHHFHCRWAGLLLFVATLLLLLESSMVTSFSFQDLQNEMPKEDPYKVLDVSQQASIDTIKKAYRQRAKESHPDKNPDVDPEEAADNFRRVVDAFEFLSDPVRKRKYDNRRHHRSAFHHNQGGQQQNNRAQQQHQQQEQKRKNTEKRRKEKEQANRRRKLIQDARLAQTRVLRLSSLEQFRSVLLDNHGRYERHFFGVFVSTKKMEQLVDDEYLFPFPFAGVGRNQIWWEDVIQTAKIRYNTETPLTETFRAPSVKQAKKSGQPYIVFCKKGDPIEKFHVYKVPKNNRDPQQHLEDWVNQQLSARVTVVNHHSSTVKLFLIDGTKLRTISTLPTDHQLQISLQTTDRLVAIDAGVDQFPGSQWSADLIAEAPQDDSILLLDVIVKNDGATIDIRPKKCYDMSLRCSHLVRLNSAKCDKHSEYMHNICAASCGVCTENSASFLVYGLLHYPLSRITNSYVRDLTKSGRNMFKVVHYFGHDVQHVLSLRKNVAFVFFLAGLLGGMNLIFLRSWALGRGRRTATTTAQFLSSRDSELLLSLATVGAFGCWIATAASAPSWLQGLQLDIQLVTKFSMDAAYGLIALGAILYFVSNYLVRWMTLNWSTRARDPKGFQNCILVSLCAMCALAIGVVMAVAYLMKQDHAGRRSVRWKHLWRTRRNATAEFLVVGVLFGSAIGPLTRIALRLKGFVFKLLLNVAILAAVYYGIISQDRHFGRDLDHVLKLRLSAAACFAAMGLLFGLLVFWLLASFQVKIKVAGLVGGINFRQLKKWVFGYDRAATISRTPQQRQLLSRKYFEVFLSLASVLTFGFWIVTAASVPSWLRAFQSDMHHVMKWNMDAACGLIALGVLIYVASNHFFRWTSEKWSTRTSDPKEFQSRILLSLCALCALAVGVVVTVVYLMKDDRHRSIRWKHLWKMRKNAAAATLAAGVLFGSAIDAICLAVERSLQVKIQS